MKKGQLEIIVFLSGAVVMTLELVAARVIAPYLGTSLIVWTSLIGVILGSLSFGYWLGGKVADKKTEPAVLAWILLAAALTVALSTVIKDIFLAEISLALTDLRIQSILATSLLFAPPSILLGTVSPYAVKLKLKHLEETGSTVGKLSALSTLGSIVGTFLTGFYLIAFLGSTQLLIALSLTLLILSLMAFPKRVLARVLIFIISASLFPLQSVFSSYIFQPVVADIDTQYNRILIYDDLDRASLRPIRRLSISNENSSAMFLEGDDLVYRYTSFYDLAAHFYPGFQRAMMLGGAAYSYPKYFLKRFPEARIDVVEIDPELTELAKKYFRLREDPRLGVYHQDGRVFLNQTDQTYDVIFGDAFRSFYSVPYQLTTLEAVQKMYDHLTPRGIVLVNIISAIEGEKGEFLRAEYATFRQVFPQVYVLAVTYPDQGEVIQNLMLVALKSTETPKFSSDDPFLNAYLKNLWSAPIPQDLPILTDELAPVDQYIMKLI